MNIKEIELVSLEIPFRVEFRHTSASRNATETAWVTVQSEKYKGHGESCPRSYVTGETIGTVQSFFATHKVSIQEKVIDLESLSSWVAEHHCDIDKNPAAWCAIELALLDLLAQEENISTERLLGLPELSGDFQYTAVLGDNKIEHFSRQVDQYIKMGFEDYKIKICGDIERDKEKLRYLQEEKPNTRIRLDANNLWKNAGQAIEYLGNLEAGLFAIEEPLIANDYDGLRDIAKALNIKIILDESFLHEEQFSNIQDNPILWIINIRVSKMGGLLRSIKIAEEARRLGIKIVIGAQVGETSLLTRSALTIANATRDILEAQEGAYGTILLERDICHPSLMFGNGGRISQAQIDHIKGCGFGLNIE